MTDIFKFYHSENNPPNLTGVVGGAISANELNGSLNELFIPIDSSTYSGSFFQYRKFWIKQMIGSYASISVKTSNLEYLYDFSYATGHGSDTSISPSGMPSTLIENDFVSGSSSSIVLGSGSSGDIFPIWVRHEIISGQNPDSLESFNFRIV